MKRFWCSETLSHSKKGIGYKIANQALSVCILMYTLFFSIWFRDWSMNMVKLLLYIYVCEIPQTPDYVCHFECIYDLQTGIGLRFTLCG